MKNELILNLHVKRGTISILQLFYVKILDKLQFNYIQESTLCVYFFFFSNIILSHVKLQRDSNKVRKTRNLLWTCAFKARV